jgi:hypothetical protein
MDDPVLTSLAYVAAGIYVLRRAARMLRDFLDLRNEWYRRER